MKQPTATIRTMHGYPFSPYGTPQYLTMRQFLLSFLSPHGGYTIRMPKGKPRIQSAQQRILHRLKIARGHLSRVIRMAESEHHCIDVIHQSLAVQAALRSTDRAILKNHLTMCVGRTINKEGKDEVIRDLIRIMETS